MLYMVMNRGTRQLKIGYTSNNWATRSRAYDSHNPNIILIDVCDGDKALESEYHEFLRDMNWLNVTTPNGKISKEWFEIPKGIKKNDIKNLGFKYFATI